MRYLSRSTLASTCAPGASTSTPAKAGAQLRRVSSGGAAVANENLCNWAPAFAEVDAVAGVEEDAGWHDRQTGFTLVELMVALLVFAILASAGVALLSFSVRAQAATSARLDDLAALQRTLSILSADLAQARDRPQRDEAGTVLPAFAGGDGAAGTTLRLVRGGWTNLDAQPRADDQKVAYRLNDGVLERLAWPRLDGAAPLPVQPLLTKVQSLTIRYRYKGAWSDRWDGGGGVPLPQALELRVRRAGVEYRQLFLVGTGYAPVAPPSQRGPAGASG